MSEQTIPQNIILGVEHIFRPLIPRLEPAKLPTVRGVS
jgi:hypothetical protein